VASNSCCDFLSTALLKSIDPKSFSQSRQISQWHRLI
jgi:hypothetical protein